MNGKQNEAADMLKEESRRKQVELDGLEEKYVKVEQEWKELMLLVPNLLSSDSPI